MAKNKYTLRVSINIDENLAIWIYSQSVKYRIRPNRLIAKMVEFAKSKEEEFKKFITEDSTANWQSDNNQNMKNVKNENIQKSNIVVPDSETFNDILESIRYHKESGTLTDYMLTSIFKSRSINALTEEQYEFLIEEIPKVKDYFVKEGEYYKLKQDNKS